jgi:hypothetical protein
VSLQQIDNGVVIPPSGWKCAKCDKKDNLWLNLTDGMILCGRKNWDGSGGNNHAIEHYEQTKHPLAVKLGTITADLEAAGDAPLLHIVLAFICSYPFCIQFVIMTFSQEMNRCLIFFHICISSALMGCTDEPLNFCSVFLLLW